jgi:hypothetical protein
MVKASAARAETSIQQRDAVMEFFATSAIVIILNVKLAHFAARSPCKRDRKTAFPSMPGCPYQMHNSLK